jgi:hypothetical protein
MERDPKVVGLERAKDAGPVRVEKEMQPGKAQVRERVVAVERVRANGTARDEKKRSRKDTRLSFPKGGKSCQVEIGQAHWAKVP